MNAVQGIKARNDEREWADIEAILQAIQPALKINVERRREGRYIASAAGAASSGTSAA